MGEHIHLIERRTTLDGFDFFGFMRVLTVEEQVERSKSEVIGVLSANGDKFARSLEELQEDFLSQRVAYPLGMMPASKSRFEMLMSFKEHEMHHRGQLMLIERMLGIVPHLTRQMQSQMAASQSGRGTG